MRQLLEARIAEMAQQHENAQKEIAALQATTQGVSDVTDKIGENIDKVEQNLDKLDDLIALGEWAKKLNPTLEKINDALDSEKVSAEEEQPASAQA